MPQSAEMREPGDLTPTPMYRAPAGSRRTRHGSPPPWWKKTRAHSHHKRTRTGVAVATLPTSSSACIIFLMRDGGKAAVEDLRRPMTGDPSVPTRDYAVRAFTRPEAARHGPEGDKNGETGAAAAHKIGDGSNKGTSRSSAVGRGKECVARVKADEPPTLAVTASAGERHSAEGGGWRRGARTGAGLTVVSLHLVSVAS